MDGFFATLKQIFDAFGNYITVPIIIYVICRIFKTPRKRAFQSAVLVGVGLMGMSFVTTAFGGVLTPLITRMVDASGLSKPALDIGWQAVAAVCYSTDLGMMFIGVGLLFQIVLWFGKWTDIFMPSDLWNNYSISVWGSFLFLLTGNMPLAFGLMLFINLVILLIAEAVQKRWSTYYNYPGCAMTAPTTTATRPCTSCSTSSSASSASTRSRLTPNLSARRLASWASPCTSALPSAPSSVSSVTSTA